MTIDHAGHVCPNWCDADHSVQFHDVDRRHWSNGVSVAAVALNTRLVEGCYVSEEAALTIHLGLEQEIETGRTFALLALGDQPEHAVLLSLGTAERLRDGLNATLRSAGRRACSVERSSTDLGAHQRA